jgi:hypothetical protein
MPRDDNDDDLYDEEFDFVDDDEDAGADSHMASDAEVAPEAPVEKPRRGERPRRNEPPPDDFGRDAGEAEAEEPVDEYGRPAPAANYVVHIYENKKLRRTIDRPFTPEEAEAFATEYNRTAKPYGRIAAAGKNDAAPKKTLD